jgi:hypothetical protein
MTEKKKGFFDKLVDSIDKKLEKKSKEKKCGCCCSGVSEECSEDSEEC